MGVRDLTNYMNRGVEKGMHYVKIIDEIKRHKRFVWFLNFSQDCVFIYLKLYLPTGVLKDLNIVNIVAFTISF